MVNLLELHIIVEIGDFAYLRHQPESFDIEAGRGFVMTAIANAHFAHREIAHMIRRITATLGGNVDERLIEVGEEFEGRSDGVGWHRIGSNRALSLLDTS